MPANATRRGFLQQSAGVALGAAGLYELVDILAGSPARAAATVGAAALPEQHLLRNVRVLTDNGVEIDAPPLHHQLVTAKLRVARTKAALRKGQRELEQVLREVDSRFPATPAGLGITVAWGLPYFRRFVPGPWRRYAPRDLRANTPALLDAFRFPSDPRSLILDRNDLVVQLRSDRLDHVATGAKLIFGRLGELLEVTSIRKGFVGGGYDGSRGLPKQMALKAGIPAASRIPDSRPALPRLHLLAAKCARAGCDRQSRDAAGVHRPMAGRLLPQRHDDASLASLPRSRAVVRRVHLRRPGLGDVPTAGGRSPGTQTVPQGPREIVNVEEVLDEIAEQGFTGHSAAMQPETRLTADTVDNYGNRYRSGTALIQRPDFDTLDNPFAWTARPTLGQVVSKAKSRRALRRLLADQRHVPPHPPRNGRPLRRRNDRPARPERPEQGLQLGHGDDTSAELHRPAASTPVVPAGRVALARAGLDDLDERPCHAARGAPLLDCEAPARPEVDDHDRVLATLQQPRLERPCLEPIGVLAGVADEETRLVAALEPHAG